MVSTVLLLVLVWAITVPVVLALGRLLSRVSTSAAAPRATEAPEEARAGNVVPLVSRPQNALEAPRRRAA